MLEIPLLLCFAANQVAYWRWSDPYREVFYAGLAIVLRL